MKKILSLFLVLTFITMSLSSCLLKNHTHEYGEWVTLTEASCTSVGKQERACSCGEKETQDIPKFDHSFSSATCLAAKKCTVCSTVEGDPLGHDFSPITDDVPTLISGATVYEKCSRCSEMKVTDEDPIGPQELDMPVIYITDIDASAIPLYDLEKSDGEIAVKYEYVSNSSDIQSFTSFCSIKVQGASSQYYPKKNFTVKFYEDEALSSKLKVDLGWGNQNKYCMKANYIDSSHARNIVSARLFSEVIQSRTSIEPGLIDQAPNYGVIDGYPVLVYLNGEFHGLYTMNIPKDKWTFGMSSDESKHEALLMADHWSDSVALKEEIGYPYEDYEWELEHCSTADDSWVRDSFNELIRLLNCGDNEKIKQELPQHLDIEAAIDNMLFTFAISAADNVSKNVLWATYDGKVWIPSMYDMDGTFGIIWNGQPWGSTEPYEADYVAPEITEDGELDIPGSKLYEILITCYADEVEARWDELRKDVLSIENISEKFDEFFAEIPDVVYVSEQQKWEEIPFAKNNLSNMYAAAEQQLARLDEFFHTFNK